jgi:serine/threonine protein phosphatase PrpC
MGIIAAGATDIGRKRKSNQDSIYLNKERHLYVVADGMGGHQGGDIASQMAVKIVPEFLLPKLQPNLAPEDAQNLTKEAVLAANKAIYDYSQKDEKLRGMGTTVVYLLFDGPHLHILNVGDSRAYLFHQKKLYQLSNDHSLVQEKVNMGLYTRAEAAQDKMKNVLVRTVGFEPQIEVDHFSFKVHKHDLFLICSDGLHGRVSDHDIMHIVNRNIPDPTQVSEAQIQKTVKDLIDQANANGGQDNISVILTWAA